MAAKAKSSTRITMTVPADLYARAAAEVAVTRAPITTVLLRYMETGAEIDKVRVKDAGADAKKGGK